MIWGWIILGVLALAAGVTVVAVRHGNTNCLNVAAAGWISHRGKSWFAVRRSISFNGVIPHFAHIRERGATLVMVDYIPTNRKSNFFHGDSIWAFKGLYRVRMYRAVATGVAPAFKDAVADARAQRNATGGW